MSRFGSVGTVVVKKERFCLPQVFSSQKAAERTIRRP
jgi:hypothetical protein